MTCVNVSAPTVSITNNYRVVMTRPGMRSALIDSTGIGLIGGLQEVSLASTVDTGHLGSQALFFARSPELLSIRIDTCSSMDTSYRHTL